MGQTLLGSQAMQTGSANMMTPEQSQYLQGILGTAGPQSQGAYGNLLQGFSEDTFQKGVVDPSLQAFQQQILPQIYQSYGEAGGDSSSALNQALGAAAGNLATSIGSQRLPFAQMQQQGQLGALGQLGQLGTAQTQAPIVQGPQTGILQQALSALLQGLGQAGGAWAGGKV
jgi:hypothetical protein